MSRSTQASRFGAAAERHAISKYGLEASHESWHDAKYQNGTPVEIKSAMASRSSGQPGKFRVFEEYHRILERHEGWYCFVVYRPRGQGVQIVESKMVRARDLPNPGWYGAGGHRDSRQTKVPIRAVFR